MKCFGSNMYPECDLTFQMSNFLVTVSIFIISCASRFDFLITHFSGQRPLGNFNLHQIPAAINLLYTMTVFTTDKSNAIFLIIHSIAIPFRS